MIATVETKDGRVKIDLNDPIDISIPLREGEPNVNAWYVDPVKMEPFIGHGFVGSVAQGGTVNFRDIKFNPHGNGTHTECVGHIAEKVYTINQNFKKFWFRALLVTIEPEEIAEDRGIMGKGDRVITKEQLSTAIAGRNIDALVIRTRPNPKDKLDKHYSNTNPPYMDHEGVSVLDDAGVKHLLIDLPSVDRERDEGKLLTHHAFWQYPESPQFDKTITELIYVPDEVEDGGYLLNVMIASFENDASPSKPLLYKAV